MEFRTKISAGMTVSENGKRIIRVPRDLRAELGINVGEHINMDTKDGTKIKLLAEQALVADVEQDPMAAYVSQSVFEVLALKDIIDSKYVVNIKDNITLGTDPEYFIVNFKRNEVIHPARFFNKYGDVGHDGMLAEIRPTPDVSAAKLVSNIAFCLTKARDLMRAHPLGQDPNLKMAAASHFRGYTAGFHLHYGLPKEILNLYNTKRMILKQLVRTLDYYVGVPSIIPEGIADSSRRSTPFCGYGKVGDFRADYRTLEYRVPGGSLLRHPDLAEGLIGLGALVVEDVISRLRIATNDFKELGSIQTPEDLNEIYPNVPSMETLFQTVCVPHVDTARDQLERIHNDIQNMVSYNRRKASADKFFDNIERPYSCYLEDNWGLNNNKTLTATT